MESEPIMSAEDLKIMEEIYDSCGATELKKLTQDSYKNLNVKETIYFEEK